MARIIVLRLVPLYSGELIRGAVAVIRDKTEQNRLEKLRSDFIANVSHELRTPIAMLQGYSEAILDDVVQSEEERHEMIRIIYDESQRMGTSCNRFIRFSSHGIRPHDAI